MSSSKGDASNKMPWMKKMMGRLNYEAGLVEKARRDDEKKEDNSVLTFLGEYNESY
jgi:hypothetical protein